MNSYVVLIALCAASAYAIIYDLKSDGVTPKGGGRNPVFGWVALVSVAGAWLVLSLGAWSTQGTIQGEGLAIIFYAIVAWCLLVVAAVAAWIVSRIRGEKARVRMLASILTAVPIALLMLTSVLHK